MTDGIKTRGKEDNKDDSRESIFVERWLVFEQSFESPIRFILIFIRDLAIWPTLVVSKRYHLLVASMSRIVSLILPSGLTIMEFNSTAHSRAMKI